MSYYFETQGTETLNWFIDMPYQKDSYTGLVDLFRTVRFCIRLSAAVFLNHGLICMSLIIWQMYCFWLKKADTWNWWQGHSIRTHPLLKKLMLPFEIVNMIGYSIKKLSVLLCPIRWLFHTWSLKISTSLWIIGIFRNARSLLNKLFDQFEKPYWRQLASETYISKFQNGRSGAVFKLEVP